MAVLVVNPGSSSLKLHLLDDAGEVIVGREIPLSGGRLEGGDIAAFLADHPDVTAVGVRVVHGGAEFRHAVLVDQKVEDRLAEVADLAPLHDPPALEAVRLVRRACADLPAGGLLRTAFFAGLPAAAATYALPWTWIERWGLRRFGFHGLSHAYATRRTAAVLARPAAELRLVVCHLGAGASVAAVAGGAPVDTTMGFTPLDGLVMATRPGAVDPGLLLWVQQHGGLPVDEVGRGLLFEAGFAGLSGTSGDMRDVIAAADGGDERASLALSVYLHRLRGSIASMVASLGGLDAVVFTGGVGQNSGRIRADACAGLAFLGLSLDPERNRVDHAGDRDVATAESPVRILDAHSLRRQQRRNPAQAALMLVGMLAGLGTLAWLLLGGRGLVWVLVLGIVVVAIRPKIPPRWILSMYGARPLPEAAAPEFHRFVRVLAQRAGLSSPPALYYVASPLMNDFALGRPDDAVLAVTDGLLRHLSSREVAAVLAHEISHVRADDLWIMNLSDAVGRMTHALAYTGLLPVLSCRGHRAADYGP